MAIGNPRPSPSRPMPRRLYRFTTERRTSVNRYLLTLDFPWPPSSHPLPPPPPLAEPSLAESLSLAFRSEAPSPRPPPSFFRPSALSGRRRHPSPAGQGVGGKGVGSRSQIARDDVALARARGVVMKTYEIYSIWADAITPPADRGGGQRSSFPLTTNPLHGYTCARMKQVCVYGRARAYVCARCGASSF